MATKAEAPASFKGALVAALAEIGGAAKDKINPAFKSKYADLESVIDAIKPVLARHGLGFTQHPEPSADGVTVETFVHHGSGETMSLGKLFVPANKKDAQGFGSAMTYARRYSLMTAFGVPAEDDDGNAAAKSAPAANSNADAPMCSDDQRDLIVTMAEAAGKPLQDICAAYKVPSLNKLTSSQADAAIKRLQSISKEAVNA